MSRIKPKTGLCAMCNDGIEKPLIAKLCAARHYWQSRAKPVQQKPRTPIPKQSAKEKQRQAAYKPKAAAYREKHEDCEARLSGCMSRPVSVHHKGGRAGKMLLDEDNFIAVCDPCHRKITDQSKDAIDAGLSIRRNTAYDQRSKNQE